MSDIPAIPGDPRTRDELKDWLERREKLKPDEPLTAREYLMIERLRGKRPPYSIT